MQKISEAKSPETQTAAAQITKAKSESACADKTRDLMTRAARKAKDKIEHPLAIAARGRQKLKAFSFAASIKYITGTKHRAAAAACSKTPLSLAGLPPAEKALELKKAVLRTS